MKHNLLKLDNNTELFKFLKYLSIVKKFTFVDLFASIGGFRIALENLGGKYLGYSEIDGKAINV